MSTKVEVTYEDQRRINAFSKMNAKMHDLEAQVVARKKILEDLEDAENELMLSDEESVRFTVGECFVHMEREAAEERLAEKTTETKAEVDKANAEIEEIRGALTELKKVLYAKFGNSINLEEEVAT